MAHAQIDWAKNVEQLPWRGEITKEEVAKHNKPDDCWVILHGFVYDVTCYLNVHPAGPPCIMLDAGADITQAYMERHKWVSPNLISKLKIGELKKE